MEGGWRNRSELACKTATAILLHRDEQKRDPMAQWITINKAARAVHAFPDLIHQWIQEGRLPTQRDPRSQQLLVLDDDVEELAEEEAFRRLSNPIIAQED
jgi:hypothetical protein